ncbi:MAG: family 16 glycoside hydrolase [Rikenellaceae bacterium]
MKHKFYYTLIAMLAAACAQNSSTINMDSWIVNGEQAIETEYFTLNQGDRALLSERVSEFDNFELEGEFMLSDGAQAALMFHTEQDMAKGYEIFLGNGAIDSEIKSGSLTGVRNLFKSLAKDGEWSNFAVKVSGQRIIVEMRGNVVVDYIEPDSPYRSEKFAQRVLSSGNFALLCSRGEVEFKGLKVTPINDAQMIDSSRLESEDSTRMALQQELFPLIDYHVHLKGLSKEEAYQRSLRSGINYGIAPNCGIGFPITTDAHVKQYCDSTRTMPFMFGMQGEGREWHTTFSKESRELFDYVFSDALTFHDHRGRRSQLWIDSLVHVDIPVERYMDMLVDRAVMVINSEPIDFFVNPTLLPVKIRAQYDKLWTTPRMDRVIKALKDNNVALEINDRYEIPSVEFLKRAKAAGLKFTFGTNNNSAESLRDLDYAIMAAIEVGLTKDDMWSPAMKQDK